MSNIRTLARSFAGGEITPELYGRIDLVKFQTGLSRCRNFITAPHGPAFNRAGFEFVREVKAPTVTPKLIPFSFNNQQTFVIEVGAGYFRFHTMGATLMNGAVPYEVANTFAAADLADIHYVQSADVLTLVHPNYPPQELRRLGALSWALTTVIFTAPTNYPGNVRAEPSGTGSTSFQYAVTTINENGLEESVISSPSAAITNNLSIAGSYNAIAWDAVAGAVRYNVYKWDNGVYSYIGQAGIASFIDRNITADASKTPPTNDVIFGSAGNYPSAVSYYEQRRVFAGTQSKPQNCWMTRSGTESSMAYSIPTRSDDRIAFRIAAREASAIRHIVPLSNLILLTASGEWRIFGGNSEVLTPASLSIKPQAYVGANNVQPVTVNGGVLYAQSRGGRLREMTYNYQANSFLTNDITLLAPHLFDGQTITDLAFSRAPIPVLWSVSSNGKMMGMTYVPEQQVAAWHQHDTGDGDAFEAVATVTEDNEDYLYAVIRRTSPTHGTIRTIERMASRRVLTHADAFFVDCGSRYIGAPVTTISGLPRAVEGRTVSILADGCVMSQRIVSGGSVTIEQPASNIVIGLPITSDLQTPPLAAQIDPAMGQGRTKSVNTVWVRTSASIGGLVGPNFDSLTPLQRRFLEPPGTPLALTTGETKVAISPTWDQTGSVCIRQSDPLPMMVVSMAYEVALGG